jgi:hypothetical protein
MELNDIYPSQTLKAEDLKGQDCTVKIAGYESVSFDAGPKLVLSFAGTDKTLVCNKTNSQTVASFYGTNLENWIGKEITLFPTQTEYAGKQVACIRVRLQPPQPAPAATPERQALPGNPQRQPPEGYDSPF